MQTIAEKNIVVDDGDFRVSEVEAFEPPLITKADVKAREKRAKTRDNLTRKIRKARARKKFDDEEAMQRSRLQLKTKKN